MEPVKKTGSRAIQYLAAGTGFLGMITDGMHYGWPSPSLPQLLNHTEDSPLFLTNNEGSWMAVMPLLGAIVGALTAANIVDYFGRKRSILATAVPFFVAWIMVAFAHNVALLFVARFIAGIADGVIFTVVPMYIGEIVDPEIRGRLGSGCSISWIAGFLLINLLGSYLSIKHAALIASIVPVILFLTFMGMPESPYYCIMRNDEERAKKNLERLKSTKDIQEDFDRINNAVKSSVTEKSGRCLELFTVKSNLKAVCIIAGLRGFQQFSGTTAITFYAQDIFKQAGDDISPQVTSSIYFSVQLIVTILAATLVDRWGRRPLLIISMAGSAIALALEGTYFYLKTETDVDTTEYTYLPVIFLIGYTVIFSFGMQSIPIAMLGELFPTNVKAYALCMADVYYSIVATIAAKFLQITKDSYGMYCAFYGFFVFSFIGLIFIIFCVPETKEKTLEEIQVILGNNRINNNHRNK